MPIKIIQPGEDQINEYSEEQFNQIMGFEYVNHLEFLNREKVLKYVNKAERKKLIEQRQKWLGVYYGQEIRAGYTPDLTICWLNEALGFGVITNVDLPKRAYIGEYTGIVRRRKFFEDHKNGYCFVYGTPDIISSPFVIDAQPKGNYTRFINHSDSPNLEPAAVYCDGLLHIILYTIKPIAKGTQLTYDYGEDYWKKRKKIAF